MSGGTIVMKNVIKAFGAKKVLQDISLDIPKAEIFGILGPSGCGKTTAIKAVAGMLACDSGSVEVLGQRVPQLGLLHRIGYMAQGDALYMELTARENLKFLGRIYGMSRQQIDLRIAQTLDLVDLLPDADVQVKNYSGGMKRRLSLAGALLHQPEVIILDEPTVGIDPVLRQKIWMQLAKLAGSGITVLLTTHVMDEAAKCDRLAMMRSGRIIAQGTCQELMEAIGVGSIEEAFIVYGGGDNADNSTGTADTVPAKA